MAWGRKEIIVMLVLLGVVLISIGIVKFDPNTELSYYGLVPGLKSWEYIYESQHGGYDLGKIGAGPPLGDDDNSLDCFYEYCEVVEQEPPPGSLRDPLHWSGQKWKKWFEKNKIPPLNINVDLFVCPEGCGSSKVDYKVWGEFTPVNPVQGACQSGDGDIEEIFLNTITGQGWSFLSCNHAAALSFASFKNQMNFWLESSDVCGNPGECGYKLKVKNSNYETIESGLGCSVIISADLEVECTDPDLEYNDYYFSINAEVCVSCSEHGPGLNDN